MDCDEATTGVEQLLAHFLIGALGLTLQSAIRDVSAMPARRLAQAPSAQSDPPVWAAWNTDRGVVRICGAYDGAQSRRLSAHVLFIGWWIAPGTHHEGWWRCCGKRPREWTKGYGGESMSPGAESTKKPARRMHTNAA